MNKASKVKSAKLKEKADNEPLIKTKYTKSTKPTKPTKVIKKVEKIQIQIMSPKLKLKKTPKVCTIPKSAKIIKAVTPKAKATKKQALAAEKKQKLVNK